MNRIGDSLFCTGANEELIRALTSNAAEFIVIGGLAVAWHCPNRQADDMDLLVNPTLDNSDRICRALSKLNLSGYSSTSFARPGLQVPLKQIHYAELLTPREGDPSYSEVAADAVEAKVFNIPVRVASVASLIRQKERAVVSGESGKDKHLTDIQLLKTGK